MMPPPDGGTAARGALARTGFSVIGLDTTAEKIAALNRRKAA